MNSAANYRRWVSYDLYCIWILWTGRTLIFSFCYFHKKGVFLSECVRVCVWESERKKERKKTVPLGNVLQWVMFTKHFYKAIFFRSSGAIYWKQLCRKIKARVKIKDFSSSFQQFPSHLLCFGCSKHCFQPYTPNVHSTVKGQESWPGANHSRGKLEVYIRQLSYNLLFYNVYGQCQC